MPQPAWLVYGPPGCGKTTWILSQVRAARRKLFHWNARTDRTLREGRECLHQQVRSQEPLFVWIEGADDLTPEAQAFLRRILETSSQPVQCILECRDPQKITPAIQSRCEWKQTPNKSSFRKEFQFQKLGSKAQEKIPFTHCSEGYINAADPIAAVIEYLNDERENIWKQALISLKEIGGGASPWAHLYALRAADEERNQSQES